MEICDKIQRIPFEDIKIVNEIFGNLDKNIKLIQSEFGVQIYIDNSELIVKGCDSDVSMVSNLLCDLYRIVQRQKTVDIKDISYAIELIKSKSGQSITKLLDDIIVTTSMGKTIRPKTIGQKRYLDSIKANDVVFGIGPAGTGKTYLAMAMAVAAFKNKEVNRIIITRPAVEAGESLGFLPGDLQNKVDPYLRPIYDALFEILGHEIYVKYFEKGLIEVAPLAYMRGRTLDNAFIVLDEAQNTTNEQMKMFLTRMGYGSKAVITGDITQIDLPRGRKSGLLNVVKILKGIKGIDIIYLSKQDIVRHKLVMRIIAAYENFEKKLENDNDQIK